MFSFCLSRGTEAVSDRAGEACYRGGRDSRFRRAPGIPSARGSEATGHMIIKEASGRDNSPSKNAAGSGNVHNQCI